MSVMAVPRFRNSHMELVRSPGKGHELCTPSGCVRSSWLGVLAVSGRRLSGIRHLNPFLVGLGLGVVIVVPVPPLVPRGLGVTFGRILPLLLAAERSDIEVAPDGPHRFVAAVIDEIGAENLVAVA